MRRATLIAANVGRFFAFLFIFVGVWQMFTGNFGGGLWVAFIGWFLDNAASAQVQQTVFQGLLAGHKVSQAMSSQYVWVPSDVTLQQVVNEQIPAGGQRCVLVNRGGETVGLLTLHRIREVPRNEWGGNQRRPSHAPAARIEAPWPGWGIMDRSPADGSRRSQPTARDQRRPGGRHAEP
jgi:hypothetical protein